MTEQPAHDRGHNKPPDLILDDIDPTKLVDPRIIVKLLDQNYKPLVERRDELVAGIARWIGAHTASSRSVPVVKDEKDCGATLDYLTQIREYATKEVEPARKKVKDPLDKASKAVQGWFAVGLAQAIKDASRPIEEAYTRFLQDKEAAERQRATEAAWDARQEAGRLADQARRAQQAQQQVRLLDQAADLEHDAAQLEARAVSGAAEVTRVRGEMGSVGGLKTMWRWRVENLIELVQAVSAGQETIDMLIPNEVHINTLVRPADGRRKIPGLSVYPEQKGR